MADDTPAVEQAAKQQADRADSQKQSASGPAGQQPDNGNSTSKSRTSSAQGSKTIVGLMGITVVFAVIGEEINAQKNPTPSGEATALLAGAPKILVGGAVATTLLTLLSHAGDGGRQFALGLALVSMATATLVYGGPVWSAAANAFGSKPTGGTGGSTPTAPGTSTANSVATVATNVA